MYTCSACGEEQSMFEVLNFTATQRRAKKIDRCVEYWKPKLKRKLKKAAENGEFETFYEFFHLLNPKLTPTEEEMPIFLQELMRGEEWGKIKRDRAYTYGWNGVTFSWRNEK